MAAAGADPRPAVEHSARPVVARERRGMSNWMLAAGILLAALILFLILDARRRQLSAPVTNPRFADSGAPAPAAPLYIPPEPAPTPTPVPVVIVPPVPLAPPPQPRIVYVTPPQPPQVMAPPQPQAPPRTYNAPVLVIDNTIPEAGGTGGGPAIATDADGNPTGAGAGVAGGAAGAAAAITGGRSRASVLRNRATTVPQGTLIPAVLETALDSTRPGPARALVTRDVRGFDGSKVLIPRGSRLIGEYKADLQPGQNRALVVWTRLVRPDGATIAIGSPAADPLGRVGIKGRVNSHFLERFASALLQTTLSIGTGYAAGLSGNNNSVAILSVPGGAAAGSASPLAGSEQFQRSLRVKQGVSISVFVARDLDFTSVEAKR